ncbi:hypothetical protein ABPG75_001364 [Micractinium tetrahymenae]
MAACLSIAPAAFKQQRPPLRAARRLGVVRGSADGVDGQTAAASPAAPAAQTIRLTLRKPLGLVLAERTGPPAEVFIEEIAPGGNADKDGRLAVGDTLVGCSAVILKAGKEGQYEREGYGDRVLDNWEKVMFNARSKKFDTVMAAIGSNSERWGFFTVDLEFERRAGSSGGSEGGSKGGSEGGSSS